MKVALLKTKLLSTDPDVDDASWQFVFKSDTAPNFAGITPVMAHVISFCNNVGTSGVHPVCWYISDVMSRSASQCEITVYDITAHLDGSPHGSPVALNTFTLGAVGSSPKGMPEGVAATVSFRADYGTDVEFGSHARPRARDRNRVYIGPLTTQAVNLGQTAQQCTFTDEFIGDCEAAMFNLSGTVTSGSDQWNLQVWSRVNAALKTPILTFMDNRPDYQRRRSDPRPGFRTSRALQSV